MLYIILKSERAEELEEEVQRLLDAGWKPQGGVAYSSTPSNAWYVQAVVKEKQEYEATR